VERSSLSKARLDIWCALGFQNGLETALLKSMESLHGFNMSSITSPTFQPFQTRVAEQLNCVNQQLTCEGRVALRLSNADS
jgi:hypothetical protein